MTLLLKQIFAFFKLLNSDTGTNAIAAGISCGFILGMSPALSLQTFLVIILLFFFRIQIGAATVSAFFFAFIAYLLDPIFDTVGQAILESQSLAGLFRSIYNMPILPMTRFNNSIVMGSGVTAILAFPLVFFGSRVLVKKYRITFVERFKQSKIWKFIKATSLYKWYYKYDELYG